MFNINFEEPNPENKEKELEELSLKEKQYLVDIWNDKIASNNFNIKNIEQVNNEEVKQLLFNSLMTDIKEISNEWELMPNKNLPDEKYLEEIQTEMNKVQTDRDTHWDSFPKSIKEHKGFNCVGATLLGMNALKEKGIDSYYGNPWGHVVNIIKLENGEVIYLDLKNNRKEIINPKEIEINGVKVLKIDNPSIDYRLIPIYDNFFSVGSVIGNLSGLETENKNEEAQNELQNIKNKLFPEFQDIDSSEEMKYEKERIESMEEAEKEVQNYLKNLTEEKRIELLQEVINKKEQIKNYFVGELLGDGCSDNLNSLCELMSKGLNKIKNEDVKNDIISSFLKKIEALSGMLTITTL